MSANSVLGKYIVVYSIHIVYINKKDESPIYTAAACVNLTGIPI